MSTETSMQKRNLDSSILFIQQEHAAILKGLHDEIAQLQKRCTDLTFQLTMNGLSIDEPGAVDNKMQEVQTELETSRTKISRLEKELAERDKRVERLEAEARSQRKRWLDESRSQSQAVNNLKAELEAKANNIAYLTTELHRLKQKGKIEGHSSVEASQSGHSMAAGALSQPGYLHPDSKQGTGTRSSFSNHVPAPPTREKTLGAASATSRLRRSGHRSVMAGGVTGKGLAAVHPSSADAPRNSNPLRLSSGRSSGSESPDISPFLAPKDEFVQVVGGKQAPILPPIAATAAALGAGAHPVLVHQVVSSTSQHRQKSKAAADAAIVKLAVENAVPDHAWSMAHESRSSEFK